MKKLTVAVALIGLMSTQTAAQDNSASASEQQNTTERQGDDTVSLKSNWVAVVHCKAKKAYDKSTIDILGEDKGGNENPIDLMFVSTNRNFPVPFAIAFFGKATTDDAGKNVGIQAFKDGVLSKIGTLKIDADAISGELKMSDSSIYNCKNPL